ncbi:MAG: 16S rRNA (cytidine(1402)-2'-O)-methyltransferase [bacterium]
MLYIVATPIGNLEDITLRAIRILSEADIIACEDTRHARILFERHGIKPKRLVSYHSHNEQLRAAELIEDLRTGASVALVTDAGTPGISDPAWAIVREAILIGIDVVPLPGASAVIAALCASGIDTNRFVFEGFLPLKKGRKRRIAQVAEEERTTVIYESPFRIKKLIQELIDVAGENRKAALAREISKIYETFYRGTLKEILTAISAQFPNDVKGECVLIVEGKNPKEKIEISESEID